MSRLRELLDKATPRPWNSICCRDVNVGFGGFPEVGNDTSEDAELIVTLVNAAEEIADLIDVLEKEKPFLTLHAQAAIDGLEKKLGYYK